MPFAIIDRFSKQQRRREVMDHRLDRSRDIISFTQAGEPVRGEDLHPEGVWVFRQAECFNSNYLHITPVSTALYAFRNFLRAFHSASTTPQFLRAFALWFPAPTASRSQTRKRTLPRTARRLPPGSRAAFQ